MLSTVLNGLYHGFTDESGFMPGVEGIFQFLTDGPIVGTGSRACRGHM
jgi:hypothetical protein